MQSKLSRLASLNTASVGTSSSIASGYSPSFNGIYILTPSGYQTRLFDYLDELTGNEKVETVDIDKDGDMDYLYVMGGVVYVKYNHTNAPRKIQDTSIQVTTVTSRDAVPTSPNYFHENMSTPGNISVTFSPASDRETSWRMEFFDRYLEWDMLDMKKHTEALSPKRIIDLELSKDASIQSSSSDGIVHSSSISRYLSRIGDRNGFFMNGPKMMILTGSMQFTVSPGKMIYTGNEKTRILYHT